MAEPSTAAVQEALAAPVSAEERQLAQRAVGRLLKGQHEEASEELVQLYCALRKCKGGQGRLSLTQLQKWKSTAVQSSSLKTEYWVVPLDQSRRELLKKPDLAQYVLDPSTVDEVPPTLDLRQVALVDQCVSRQQLGPGVLSMELKCGVRRTLHMGAASAGPLSPGVSAAMPLPQLQAHPAAGAPLAAPAAVDPVPTPKVTKVLARHDSESTPKSEQEQAEDIAQQLKGAFEAGRYHSSDVHTPDTASFWFRTYVRHLLSLHKQW